MAFQTGRRTVKVAAKGDAPNTGSPGASPAPTRYANPSPNPKQFVPTYGSNLDPHPSSLVPGEKATSPLADNLKNKAAEGDAGDLLGHIIQHGTARGKAAEVELQSPQTRDVDNTPYPPAFGHRSRQSDSGSPGGTIPNKLGESVFNPAAYRKPGE